jgi:hypothetical protein
MGMNQATAIAAAQSVLRDLTPTSSLRIAR